MRGIGVPLVLSIVVLAGLVLTGPAVIADGADEIDIQVSPGVISLASKAEWVTVHADIPYSQVAGITVTLNGVGVEFTKSDDRGYLVAKFNSGDVKDILEVGMVDLVLSGETWAGTPFTGTDTIKVIDVTGKK